MLKSIVQGLTPAMLILVMAFAGGQSAPMVSEFSGKNTDDCVTRHVFYDVLHIGEPKQEALTNLGQPAGVEDNGHTYLYTGCWDDHEPQITVKFESGRVSFKGFQYVE